MKNLSLILIIFIASIEIFAQGTATVNITLQSNRKVAHRGIKITFKDKDNAKQYTGTTNSQGKASIEVAADGNYEISFSNSQIKRHLRMPGQEGINLTTSYTYNGGKDDWSKSHPPSESQKKDWEAKFKRYADTVNMQQRIRPSKFETRLQLFEITLNDLNNGPLSDETVYLKALNHKKVFYGQTNSEGHLILLLPKGDRYFIEFKYDKAFKEINNKLTRGRARHKIQIQYIGTKELERREIEKEIRLKEEEEFRKKELEAFTKRMKEEGKSKYEGYKEELKEYDSEANIVSEVLIRNPLWKNKLIVCDLTGSMSPYFGDLLQWYSKEIKKDKNIQFVFFNDGDGKDDDKKVIGNTGGIYYSPSLGYDKLINLMAKVQTAGCGGDGPENNIEAIIKGSKQAKPFNSLIMIADNNAPVKDMELLKEVKKPIHIILCGANSWIEEDYLTIAYLTKGSIHTHNKDYNNISRIRNGGKISINGMEYILMNKRFLKVE